MPRHRVLMVPSPSLVVMIGVAGSGKSSFCSRNFRPTVVVSSDHCRALLTDDPADQSASGAAFGLAHRIIEERLRRKRLTVVDATNLESAGRQCLLNLAALHHLPSIAVVLDPPQDDCVRNDRRRPGRHVGREVIARQSRVLREAVPKLRAEGFLQVHRLRTVAAIAAARAQEFPLTCDRSHDRGPFDVIGDVHGCARELSMLLARLGYRRASPRRPFRHPGGRRAVLVGDLVDRGPRVVESARIAMAMVQAGSAIGVPGNHDVDLARLLRDGRKAASRGTWKSLREIEALPASTRRRFIDRFCGYVDSLPAHLVLDGGRLAVSHAGLKQQFVGRQSAEVNSFALRGETTGGYDEYGLPVRVKWAAAYGGRALVVYGHTAVSEPEWLNNTINIDTGCVYGGRLTALRYPEKEIVAVSAARAYYRSARSLPVGVGLRAATSSVPTV